VPDAELAVLRVLWERESATIRELTDAVYPGGTDAHYGTVQKLLDRLEAKGYVTRDASRRAHTFAAAVERDALIGQRLRAMAEKLCDGALTPLLTQLVQSKRLSPKEWRALRDLVDQLAPPSKPGSARRADHRSHE
jgi:predicted transcriptional regulator